MNGVICNGGKHVAVLGGGSWGTALSILLSRNGLNVKLWVYEPELVEIIRKTRDNAYFLHGFLMSTAIEPSHDLEEVLTDAGCIVLVTPTQTIRSVLEQAKKWISPHSILIGASKGIENGTLMRVSEIVSEVLRPISPVRYLVLSGPTFATGVARSQPATAVVAGSDEEAARLAQRLFSNQAFRVYINDDVTGVELGGALKNVIAIAAGIVAGLDLGSNARAALITRGLWEITRLGAVLGAKLITFQGLTGMGDLVLTCDGTESRNYQVGYRIGRGENLETIQRSMRMVAEGVKTTIAARELARRHAVEMPITEEVFQTLYHGKPPRQAVLELMTRSLKSEHQTDI
ncbi:NAD(P)-dependent glycerol-3-phosphate dehydrogenase [bacterium]|nr:NAD(P)-dependent glycerol-3-phosphate dehydrogenase [candidate division CSSED10-310 bacterium]